MYEMYPDWGPARHAAESPYSNQALTEKLQQAVDLRDGNGDLPDDN